MTVHRIIIIARNSQFQKFAETLAQTVGIFPVAASGGRVPVKKGTASPIAPRPRP